MKYKLRGIQGESAFETILNNRGIIDLNRVINPDSSNDTDTSKIINIDKGIGLIKSYLTSDSKILLLVDSDCDGLTSSAIIYRYLKSINQNLDIDLYFHEGKRHGLTDTFMNSIGGYNCDLVIVPDAGSNDIENIEKVEVEHGAKVLVIDHHEVDKVGYYGIIVNNQICDNTNKNLTGAGMSYLFCKELDKTYKTGVLDELSNLAMIGQIGDGSDILENEVRNLCLTSIKNIKNEFIKEIYKINGKDITSLTIKDLSFGGVIPMINAITRVGTIEEKEIVFDALAGINPERIWTVTKRKLNKEIRKYEIIDFEMNLYQYAAELCSKARDRQNKLTKTTIDKIEPQYNDKSDIQIFVIDTDDELKGITGLIANKLSDKFGKPSIVCWLNEDGEYCGSLRGNIKVLQDFKQWCIDTELFKLAQGHANAAGVVFDKDNFGKIIEKTHKVESTGLIYDVDYIYKEIPKDDIKYICSFSNLWNNGVEKPLFALENILIPTTSIKWSKNTMRIWVDGVTLIKFKTPEDEVNSLKEKEGYINLNIIGEFEINEWNGNQYSQIMIKDYEKIDKNEIENDFDFGIFS